MRTLVPAALALLVFAAFLPAPALAATPTAAAVAVVGSGLDSGGGCLVSVVASTRDGIGDVHVQLTSARCNVFVSDWEFGGGQTTDGRGGFANGQCDGLADGTLHCWFKPANATRTLVELTVAPDGTFSYFNDYFHDSYTGKMVRTP